MSNPFKASGLQTAVRPAAPAPPLNPPLTAPPSGRLYSAHGSAQRNPGCETRRDRAPAAARAKSCAPPALLRNDFRPFGSAINRDPPRAHRRGQESLPVRGRHRGGLRSRADRPRLPVRRRECHLRAHRRAILPGPPQLPGPRCAQAVPLPLLRKDFILHEVQIYEAACAGADAILLIVAALEKRQLKPPLRSRHRPANWKCWWKCAPCGSSTAPSISDAQLIGINNRDLPPWRSISPPPRTSPSRCRTKSCSSARAASRPRRCPPGLRLGVNAILVGETLMRRRTDVHWASPSSRSREGRSTQISAIPE